MLLVPPEHELDRASVSLTSEFSVLGLGLRAFRV